MTRWGLLLAVLVTAGCATAVPKAYTGRRFDYSQDSFAFANDTVWKYRDGERVTAPDPPEDQKLEKYSRHCFVMASAALQFWKTARFDPQAPPVSDVELARRIRRVRNTPAWNPPLPDEQRIVFPGYASFRDLSASDGKALRANLGAGWTTYFHVRKYSMPFVPSPTNQERTHEKLREWLARGLPMVVWLYNFPHVNMNHAVTVFAEAPPPAPGQFAYQVYDPNFTDGPRTLVYDPASRAFSYPPTFYFVGGLVHVRPMYLSLVH